MREVRSYLKTPMSHRGRIKGAGIDCIGLVVCVGITFGVVKPEEDDQTYQPDPPPGMLLAKLRASKLLEVPPEHAQLGDVVCFTFNQSESIHCGFLTDYGLIHVYGTAGKVVEHGFKDTVWERRVTAAFRFPGVM